MTASRLLTLAAAAMLAATVTASAQEQQIFQGGGPAGPPGPGLPGAGPQRLPPRDARGPAATGTAVIRGRVYAADTRRPLRRARITVNAPELGGEARLTSTNADGRFEIKDLPAGRYTVAVNRSGYLRLTYGQRRPFEQGKPLQLADKSVADNIDFMLPRMSLITGRLVDETGEAISGVRVMAMRTAFFEGRRRLVPVGGGPAAITDDAGQYRLLGLTPGTYFVQADLRETWTVTDGGVEQVMGYAPTYFPGTTTVEEARRVTVGTGEEATNIDFPLVPGRAATVSGPAVDSQGRPLAGRTVGVSQQYRGPNFGMFLTSGSGQVNADGSFRIRDLAPGEYRLGITSSTTVGDASVTERAQTPVVLDGVDLDNVVLQTSTGWFASGRIVSETGDAPTVPRERVRVNARPLDGDLNAGAPPGANADCSRVLDDWTFAICGVYGPSRIRATVPDGFAVKAILQDGRDVSDTVFDLRVGETLTGLDVVVTDRVNTVTGQITDAQGAPLADGTVIVFSTDPEKWMEDSRFVRSVRPDQAGKYQIRGLPPGEYFGVAIEYVEEGTWNDPEYLESIRGLGQRFTLGDADTHALMLTLLTPQ
jgi:hypothetical protein